MGKSLTPEDVRAGAALIDLPLTEDEVGPVLERFQVLLDGTDQFAHLIDNTSELDVRFNANWEDERL